MLPQLKLSERDHILKTALQNTQRTIWIVDGVEDETCLQKLAGDVERVESISDEAVATCSIFSDECRFRFSLQIVWSLALTIIKTHIIETISQRAAHEPRRDDADATLVGGGSNGAGAMGQSGGVEEVEGVVEYSDTPSRAIKTRITTIRCVR